MTSSYEEIKNARMTASQVLAAEQAHDPYAISENKLLETAISQGYRPISTSNVTDRRLHLAKFMLADSGYLTLQPLLPLLLSIRGKPYHLHDHFPFAPFFRTRMARKTLLKTGRQVSKTLKKDSEFNRVYDTFGRRYALPDIQPGLKVQSLDTSNFQTCEQEVVCQHANPRKTCYYVRTRRGVEMELAETHPLYTPEGWIPVSKLSVGVKLAHVRQGGKFSSFTTCDEQLDSIIEDIKLNKIDSLPPGLFILNKKHTFDFLLKLWKNQGKICIKHTKLVINYKSKFRNLIYDLKSLLSKFGFNTTVKKIAGNYEASSDQLVECDQHWDLCVESGSHSHQFVFACSTEHPDWTDIEQIIDKVKLDTDWDEIVEIQNIGEHECIDIEVTNTHNYLLDGIASHNSTSLAAQGVLFSNCIPYFSTLFLTPLFEMIRRFSQNYVAPFIETSPVGKLFTDEKTINNVLQRSFKNRSQMIFSFAYLDAERTRGISADKNCLIAGTQVELADGSFISIEKVKPGMTVMSANKQGNAALDEVVSVICQGVKPVFEVKFSNGSAVCCTEDERFRTVFGDWIYLSDIIKSKMLDDFDLLIRGNEKCITAKIVSIYQLDDQPVWDINTAKEHAFFANNVLVHNCIDEIQDMDISFLPIIHETISASRSWGIIQYAGTPKTLDNTIERLWIDSSMAEWLIKCPHGGCGHWNIPALEHDLLKMIGPVHKEISETCPGVICSKCAKPINPRPPYQGGTGRWVHRHPSKRWKYAGYHVPQLIMPMHYASVEKWQILVDKMNGKGNTPIHVFYNEVCGESWDSGSKLVTVTDLKRAACLPWENKLDEAQNNIEGYLYRFVSVDWGGGGVSNGKSDLALQSYTSIAVCGLCPDGRVDIIYGFRSMHPHDHIREAKLILGIMSAFKCSHVVHDYTGAGTVRETVLVQAGLPIRNILPVAYTGPAKGGLILFKPAIPKHPRAHYAMDRNRALNYCCQFIKSGVIRFFRYDYKGSDDVGLLHDFLNLIEDKSESGSGRDTYKILRDPSGPDDFAQAVTMGTLMLFQMRGQFPDLSAYEDIELSDDVIVSSQGIKDLDWY
jgi:hypothetical protein